MTNIIEDNMETEEGENMTERDLSEIGYALVTASAEQLDWKDTARKLLEHIRDVEMRLSPTTLLYHNECRKCRKLFWTADGFNIFCDKCQTGLSELYEYKEAKT